MKRRDFFKNTTLATAGATLLPTFGFTHSIDKKAGKTAKNIIFLVSDGMSTGTLNMANLLLHRKEGRKSHWVSLYEENKAIRALMDTASANSLVTDSGAASSAWGGGVRVNNGSINVNPDGSSNKPILQKFKAVGKAVGCVTTVPITHATPAGFCIASKSRDDQEGIARQYLSLRFDVMMGGGTEFFTAEKRKDKADLFQEYARQGYGVFRSRKEMMNASTSAGAPILGVFHENGLPYSLDRVQDKQLKEQVPTLAEMTSHAIKHLKNNKKGFVLQVEAGKVDWAAHANDIGGLLYDQIAFDDAIGVALDFADKDKETLVIITTDHGNANPGLYSNEKAEENFDKIQKFRYTNDWILTGISRDSSLKQVVERVEEAQSFAITTDEAQVLLKHIKALDETGVYNPKKLPFSQLAEIQYNYTSVGWGSIHHSADYVELAMYGPGSELLKPFVKNIELHDIMLKACGIIA
ncbi:alkaline phosphatase [Rufibacter immobilis]|uniref:Alkaline phosphatase n=1 Tax=Rufibacter immobilis TaxID=1348778 RepID=A0A3M9MVW9_9BACT|nr:alkaline phosphatase [Rufibacter immobilis]RNI28908.1 alkaline phosphatase [Rufibacter immobilis]